MENFKTRVCAAQSAIKAPKNQRNTFGKYNYRSCEDILEAAKPVCTQLGLLLTVSDDILQVGDRYYIKATATLRDTESDEEVSNTAFARECVEKKGMDDSQITGTASSYARKYALNGLFCIDDTKDADTDEYQKGKIEEINERFNAPPEPPKLVCEDCQKVVVGYTAATGKKVSAEKHIARSKEKYGKVLCLDCVMKRVAEESNDNAAN